MKALVALTCMVAALVAGVSVANGGSGIPANVKACQKDGWKNYVRRDLTHFTSQAKCISYAARGGVLVRIPNLASQPFCESFGGTFAAGPDEIGALPNPVVWVCNGQIVPPFESFDFDAFTADEALPLGYDCFADGGVGLHWLIRWVGDEPGIVWFTCYGPLGMRPSSRAAAKAPFDIGDDVHVREGSADGARP